MALTDLTKLWRDHSENWNAGDNAADVTEAYKCTWALRYACRDDLVGSTRSDVNANVTSGDASVSDHTICTGVNMKPYGDADSTVGGPETALLIAQYQSKAKAQQDDDSAPLESDLDEWREHWEAGGEGITVGMGFKWKSDNKKLTESADVSAVMLFPEATITLTGKTDKVNSTAKTYIINCYGKTNRRAFTIKGYTFPSDQLLCLPADLDEQASDTYVVTYRLGHRPGHTWNECWRPDKPGGPGWDTLTDGTNGPYSDASFSDLNPKNWS